MSTMLARTAPHSWVRAAVIFFLALPLPGIWSRGLAQAPSPITSSGLNTQITISAAPPAGKTQYDITGGSRPGGGTNLFHSFGEFNVPTNNIANFVNESGLATSNILGRVTLGNPSSIYGLIQVNGPEGFGNANLFLMNPAGFLFGPNATVNVGGMVTFTSADYLRLGDGARFNAVPNAAADALLSTAPVAAYGFLGSNPGAIMVQGTQISVNAGQKIDLIGGNITIQSGTNADGTPQGAHLSVAGGDIHLASVASAGEVVARTLDYAPNVNGQSFGTLGAINISQQSMIDASGDGGGTVLIRGGSFVIDDSRISANVTGPATGQYLGTAGQGIDIQVSQDVVIQNKAVLETAVTGNFPSAVKAGDISISAERILVKGVPGALFDFVGNPVTGIRSITQGTGNAGNILLTAKGNIETTDVVNIASLSGFDSAGLFGSPTSASGNAGNVEVTSQHGNILVNDSSFTSAITSQTLNSSGNTGKVTLSAPQGDIVLDQVAVFTFPLGGGRAGAVEVTAENLQMNSAILSNDNLGALKPDGLTVTLSGSLTMAGNSFIATNTGSLEGAPSADLHITAKDIVLTQGSQITSSTFFSGPAGQLTIVADTLQIMDGSQVASGSTIVPPFPGFPQGILPSGAGGSITVQGSGKPSQSILIDGQGSGIFSNTEGTGAGGNINISAQSLTVQNGGALSAATSGTAPSATGGTISVNANSVNLASGGTMTAASSGPGSSGEVVVQGLASPAQSIVIDGSGSGIFTNTSDTGAGGDIHLFANSVTLQNGGTNSAATSGSASSATGGTITVNAEHVALNSQAVITAETNGIAPAGTIDINTGTLAINSGGQIRSSSGAETEQISALALSLAAPTLTGGTITIDGRTGNGSQADSVTIDGAGSGIFTQSTGNRPGGDINILTSQSAAMTNGASVSASSTGTGNAGNIHINTGNQFAMTNSSVTTEANQASGGSIKITTTPSGTVELSDSTITASVLDGTGGGGSVDIDPQFVILQNSQILANSVFGPGGNISITTNLLLPDSTSLISASSQFGQQGTIVIQSPVSPASGKIVPLGQKPLVATALLRQRCAALAGSNASSFTVAGRDSLPAEPGGWVSSPLALSVAESNEGTATETAFSSFSEMEEGTPLLSLRKVAPAGFLTQSFGAASSDCHS